MNGVMARYRAKAEAGLITFDPAQAIAAELLAVLEGRLRDWKPGRTRFLFGRPEPAPRGLYLFGGVGRGKSMLMDLFFEAAPVQPKRRVHFHAFMQEVHAAVTAWRRMDDTERRARPEYVKGAGDDPIPPVAKAIAASASLLCFDEVQVSDITDAMILGRLFERLFANNVVVVATSNRPPRDLYKDGINRQLFVPFIERIEASLDLHALDGPKDWRMARLERMEVYHSPLDGRASMAMDKAWARLTQGADARPVRIDVGGRALDVARAAAGCARFTFEELCARPLGAADYLALCRHFDTLLIDGVPRMTPDRRNEAARFRILIDTLYEHKTKLILSAEAPADALYPTGDQSFEFERTVSRLHEMRSREYLAAERGAS